MKFSLIFFLCIFASNFLTFAQEKPRAHEEELQLGVYGGISRSNDQSPTPDLFGIGSEYGISFTRKNPNHPFQLELDLSTSFANVSSDYFTMAPNHNEDTAYKVFRSIQFFDLTVKSNLLVVNRPLFRCGLVYGLMFGKTSKYAYSRNMYDGTTHNLMQKGEETDLEIGSLFNIGVQAGLLVAYKVSDHLLLTADPVVFTKAGASIFNSDGPFSSQQLRFGVRWIFI